MLLFVLLLLPKQYQFCTTCGMTWVLAFSLADPPAINPLPIAVSLDYNYSDNRLLNFI